MKKNTKVKKMKSSSKRSEATAPEPELPTLVTAMTKFVERLESLERKMDQVLGRVSNLPSEIRNAVQNQPRPNVIQHTPAPHRPEQQGTAGQGHGGHTEVRRERTLYQAVCADCRKNCEVPFKPTEERPVYCKECFAIRKAGHSPKDPDHRSRPALPVQVQKKSGRFPSPLNFRPQGITVTSGTAVAARSGTQKPAATSARSQGAKPKKKR